MGLKGIWNKYKNSSEPLKASLWYTVCNVLSKGLALISTPIFTRLLTEEEYGTFAIFQSWFSILIIFTSLNIFMGGYTKGLLLFKGKEEEYTSASLMQTTLILLCFTCAYFINIEFWTDLFDLPPHLMAGLFWELLFMPALDFWAARKRFDYQYKQYVAVTLAMSALGLLGGVAAVILSSFKLEARVYADVAAKVLFSGIIFGIIMLRGKKLYNKSFWVYNFKFNIPLLPHYLSNYVLSQSDRIMIGKMIGKGEAGIYSVAYTISMMMNLVITAINNALTPYIYKSIEGKTSGNIKRVTRPMFVLVAGLSILAMTFAPEIILIFGGQNYMDAIYIIPPVSASVYFIFVYAMFSTIEYYFQKTGLIAIATTLCAALNLILNFIFINLFGYYAAGYTTLVCYACLTLAHFVFYKRVISKEMGVNTSLYDEKAILLTSIVVVAVMLLMSLIYSIFWLRYLIIAALVVTAVIKRKTIKETLLQFKK